MKQAAKDRSLDPGSPPPAEEMQRESADSRLNKAPRPPKQARRSSESSNHASADRATLVDFAAHAAEETKESASDTSEQGEKPSAPPQPSATEKEESQDTKAGVPSASETADVASTHAEDAPSNQSAVMAFPVQLLDLLQRNTAPDALWFFEGGEAIGINRKLIDKVLNEHFRGMKFNSFVRNLNRWGFRRISHQALKKDERGYHHLLFQRDKPHLVHRMKRDSNAKEIIRQLDLEDGNSKVQGNNGPDDASAQVAPEPGSEANPTPVSLGQSPLVGHSLRQQLPSGEEMQGLYNATLGRPSQQQHLIWQSLAAQQHMEWQRQHAAFAQIGAGQSMWANTMERPQLPRSHLSVEGQPQNTINPAASHTQPQPSAGHEGPPAPETKTDQDVYEDTAADSTKRS